MVYNGFLRIFVDLFDNRQINKRRLLKSLDFMAKRIVDERKTLENLLQHRLSVESDIKHRISEHGLRGGGVKVWQKCTGNIWPIFHIVFHRKRRKTLRTISVCRENCIWQFSFFWPFCQLIKLRLNCN